MEVPLLLSLPGTSFRLMALLTGYWVARVVLEEIYTTG